ncbi:MAG: phosphotransferase [Planctomycetaceae bacterium]
MEEPHAEDLDRIARAIGERPSAVRWARGHGAPSNRRYVVSLRGGTAFVKVAAFDYTAGWLRREHEVYEALGDRPFLPRLLGWDDDGIHPILALEDLSLARWPPPWDRDAIEAVVSAAAAIHATAPPAVVGEAEDALSDIREGWNEVRADPEPAIRTGVCTAGWLERHLDVLERAADETVIAGEAFVHLDIRSDNLCFLDGRAVLVDWNWASRGDPLFDIAAWLPSLAAEGGPPPWEVVAEAGVFASLLAGFFLAHAVREPIPQAPHVRALQLAGATASLPWAARVLGLPDPASP